MTTATTGSRDQLKGELAKPAPAPRLTPAQLKRPQDLPTIRSLIDAQTGELARALPKHLDADRLARLAFTVVRKTPDLQKCSAESLLGALMTCAQLGLEPGPLGHAYFVPYGSEATFILGYKGMIDLALRSGKIVSLIAREVYASDEFLVEYGVDDRLVHKPALFGDRGDVIAYYAVAKLQGGGHAFVVLSTADVEKNRKRSRAKDSGPWKTDYDAMAKKTCIRRLFTYLPTSVELQQAIGQDGQVRTEVRAEALDESPGVYDEPVEGEVVETEAGTVTGNGEILQGEVQVEEPDERSWPEAAQPAGGKA